MAEIDLHAMVISLFIHLLAAYTPMPVTRCGINIRISAGMTPRHSSARIAGRDVGNNSLNDMLQ